MSIKQFPGGIVTKNPTAPTTSAAKGIWTLDQVSNYVKQGIWPRSPGAPTIGTATSPTSTTASVPFTAPADLGTGSITYTATSTPGSFTGTGASPITVTGLTTGTSYTFRVSAATPGGTGPASAASNSVTPAATVPDAPTIGTATVTGSTSATVSYTAPANNGGSTITSYTATSSPSGITGTLSQAGSGTITVTGLTLGSSYTFTVKATNAIGQSAASAASNSITTALTPGEAYQGGYYGGQISTSENGVANFNLVVGPISSAQTTAQIKISNTSTSGTSSDIDGPTNSNNMNNSSNPAAFFCKGLTIGGYSDWYLGARYEMDVIYFGLKPTASNNNTNSGINNYSVPKRTSKYTSGVPAQTAATIFQAGGAQAFGTNPPTTYYWVSTQYQPNGIYGMQFGFGSGTSYSYDVKTKTYGVRAIRRVAV
jgi:hypothetical protein